PTKIGQPKNHSDSTKIDQQKNVSSMRCIEARIISKLIRLDDQLLEKFYNDEIQPILTDNQYYSLEVSETDDKTLKVCRMRKWVYNYVEFASNEEKASVNASVWTRIRYNRSLKSYVGRYSNVHYSLVHEDTNNIEEKDDSHNGNYADSFEEDNRERRSRSLVSTEYNSNYEKDDD
ncbi:16226_t:CDS:2, partial [Funneliformis caledonium]